MVLFEVFGIQKNEKKRVKICVIQKYQLFCHFFCTVSALSGQALIIDSTSGIGLLKVTVWAGFDRIAKCQKKYFHEKKHLELEIQ